MPLVRTCQVLGIEPSGLHTLQQPYGICSCVYGADCSAPLLNAEPLIHSTTIDHRHMALRSGCACMRRAGQHGCSSVAHSARAPPCQMASLAEPAKSGMSAHRQLIAWVAQTLPHDFGAPSQMQGGRWICRAKCMLAFCVVTFSKTWHPSA